MGGLLVTSLLMLNPDFKINGTIITAPFYASYNLDPKDPKIILL